MQLTKRARAVAIAVAFLLVASLGGGRADARPRTEADDALVAKLLGHAAAISTILEKDVDRPKQALAALDRYLKKHRKAMKQLVARIVAAAGELDDDARGALARELMFGDATQRFVAALTAFVDKHGEDPAYAKKIRARVDELTAEGKKLADALLQ